MRAIMMKVNYDPKYSVSRTPAAGSEKLSSRINVMRGIYAKAQLRSDHGSLHDIVEKKMSRVYKNTPKPKQCSGLIKRSPATKGNEEPVGLSIPKQVEVIRKKPLLNIVQEAHPKKRSSAVRHSDEMKSKSFADEEDTKRKHLLQKPHADSVKSRSIEEIKRKHGVVSEYDESKKKMSLVKNGSETKKKTNLFYNSDDTKKKTNIFHDTDDIKKKTNIFHDSDDTKKKTNIFDESDDTKKKKNIFHSSDDTKKKTGIFNDSDDTKKKTSIFHDIKETKQMTNLFHDSDDTKSKTTTEADESIKKVFAFHTTDTKLNKKIADINAHIGKEIRRNSAPISHIDKDIKHVFSIRDVGSGDEARRKKMQVLLEPLPEALTRTARPLIKRCKTTIQCQSSKSELGSSSFINKEIGAPSEDIKENKLEAPGQGSKEVLVDLGSLSQIKKEKNLSTPSHINKEMRSISLTKCTVASSVLSADLKDLPVRSPADVKSAHHVKNLPPPVNRHLDRSKTITFGECFGSAKTPRQRKFERRARKQAEKAMKSGMVFTIVGPYPSLRQALRRRGWVEKIHSMPSDNETSNIGKIQAVLTKSDTEINKDDTIDKKFSPWWLEENGFYLMMSHMLRHTTPSFVFTVKSFDTKMLGTDQLVNHFDQARHFTTKAGLCQNIRNATWFDKIDADSFFPRCYRLDDTTERTAFIDDYRLTACISYVKHFAEEYVKWSEMQKNEKPNVFACNGLCAGSCMSKGKPNRHQSAPVFRGEHFLRRVPSSISLMVPNVTLYYNTPESLAGGVTFRKNFGATLPRSMTMDEGSFFTKHDDSLGKALETAIKQCENFIGSKEHNDIDIKSNRSLSQAEWDDFLVCYYKFVHSKRQIPTVSQHTVNQCFTLLGQLKQIWPQFELDGSNNVWILKPGAKSRGRGIICLNKLEPILKAADDSADTVMVIQKYIERPFLTYNTKFDIRQWFLVTSWKPLVFWFYNDCYLRFCGQQFTLNNFHASIHLSNNSVQKTFKNGVRSDDLPEDNMWTSDEFIQYLEKHDLADTWKKKTIPAMQKSIVCCLLCSQEYIEGRKNAFELYGADFMLTEDLNPWLLEINSSPCMAKSTHATAQLVDNVLEDTLKVVLDRKKNHACDTGGFKLIYKQPMISDPAPINKSLLIQGHGVRKRTVSTKR